MTMGPARIRNPSKSTTRYLTLVQTPYKAEDPALQRKPHTKSRNGCIPCKRRKIKCSEERPQCTSCSYRGTDCRYAAIIPSGRSARRPPINVFVTNLSASDFMAAPEHSTFSLRDLRCFHHFLTAVPHPLPLGNRRVWASDLPQIAHRHEYLMSAMLALGGAELQANCLHAIEEPDILKHRGQAIAGLQRALTDAASWSSLGQPDAILATCYILVYQSSRMHDAIDDFSIAVRGCALVTEKLRREKIETSFQLMSEGVYERLRPDLKLADQQLAILPSVEPALRTLIDLEDYINSSKAKPFAEAISRTLMKFSHSPAEAYIESLNHFDGWYHLALGVIDSLHNPDQATSAIVLELILLANMVWLKLLIPLQIWPRLHIKSTDNPIPSKALVEIAHWVEATAQFLPSEHQIFMEWPSGVVDAIPWATLQVGLPSETVTAASVAAKLEILRDINSQAHVMLGWILRLASELASWFEGHVVANASDGHSSRKMERSYGAVPVPFGQLGTAFPHGCDGRDQSHGMQFHPSALDQDELPFLDFSRLG